ncbi:unnamed protein product [Spirodela intermedia]|uniref:Uncharacterized protein n=1 Tax=Spirodela intermedia TaxID=51605 RepID=A0A7I8JDI9_SPIIN|nr:unnamed protein product [Spirodela intermedia]CAA6668236.1 unnamed protein product [Spirodela intermedia]
MARGSSSAAAIGVPFPPAAPPVFVDTSLGLTSLWWSPPTRPWPNSSVNPSRKVCIEHAACFPSIGDVTVVSIKVRRRATYYHLSDSMLVRTAFSGIKGTWFIQMDVVPTSGHGNGPSSVDELVRDDSNLELNAHIPAPPSVSDAPLTAVDSFNEKISKGLTNDSHMDLDSEVVPAPSKGSKRSTDKAKKIKTKVQLSSSNLKKQVLSAKLEKSAEHREASDDIGQMQASGNVVNSGKEMTTYPAESSDTTEEDSAYDKKLYRIAVRKVRKSRSKKDVKRSDQEEICLNASDDTFGHFTSASSGDEAEAHGQKDVNKNVSSNSAYSYPEEDTNPTLVVRGPKVQKTTGHSGASLSTVHVLRTEEASGDDIDLSQTSNATKKRIALSVLLRGSNSYRKAKRSAPMDSVLESVLKCAVSDEPCR